MTSNDVLHIQPGPHLSASISQTPWGYKFRGTTWTTMGTSAGFSSMKTLIEEFPTWVRGNWTGLSKVKLGHESLASAGIWKPWTTSVSTVNETLTLQRKQYKKITGWINRNHKIHAAVEDVLLTSQPYPLHPVHQKGQHLLQLSLQARLLLFKAACWRG